MPTGRRGHPTRPIILEVFLVVGIIVIRVLVGIIV
jgi:hypothetical protein